MRPVSILQVVPRLDAGGSEFSTIEITQALTRAGAIALIATEGGRLAKAIAQAGGEVIEMPVASKNPITILANVKRLARLIRERDIALVHARSRAPAWSALLACNQTKRPFVTTYHGAYSESEPLKAAYNRVMSRGDRVIANSLFTADVVLARSPESRDRLRVIYRGIDQSAFDPAKVTAEAVNRLRSEWGVSNKEKLVLMAARLAGSKGQRDLIAAAGRLFDRDAIGDAIVILAGEPARQGHRRELENLIDNLKLRSKVRLVGHCRDMPTAFAAAHVAVVPSRVPETFGRTSVEAQAMGCPVIVTALGALPETIISAGEHPESFTGWQTPARHVGVLSDRIEQALSLTAMERAKIGVRAIAHVAAKFDLERMQRKTLAVYDELLATELGPRFASQL
jgi:glycosyltransferase involved in cell wall biosynthesis